MKKKFLISLLLLGALICFSSCEEESASTPTLEETPTVETELPEPTPTPTPTPEEVYDIEGDPFRLSSIVDETGSDGVSSYAVKAPHTDKYSIKCTKTSRIVVYDENSILAEGEKELEVKLVKDSIYGIRIETGGAKKNFKLQVKALDNLVTLPYDVATPVDASKLSTESDGTNPLEDATVDYVKRKGGKYIYSNNPELIPSSAVGKA